MLGNRAAGNLLLDAAVRTSFFFTSRGRALRKTEAHLQAYLRLAEGLAPECGRRCVDVPWMPGIDPEMRGWSFFMVLEHNAIVNRAVTAKVVQLAHGEPPGGAALVDPKTGVMPSASAGETQVGNFSDSVRRHIEAVRGLGKLRGTKTSPHPVFGSFDAHEWNCMFAFHLGLHLRQARFVAGEAVRRRA